METLKHIFKGLLQFILFLILVPVAIISYIVGCMEMLGSEIDCVCDTVTVKAFDEVRDCLQEKIRRLYV